MESQFGRVRCAVGVAKEENVQKQIVRRRIFLGDRTGVPELCGKSGADYWVWEQLVQEFAGCVQLAKLRGGEFIPLQIWVGRKRPRNGGEFVEETDVGGTGGVL